MWRGGGLSGLSGVRVGYYRYWREEDTDSEDEENSLPLIREVQSEGGWLDRVNNSSSSASSASYWSDPPLLVHSPQPLQRRFAAPPADIGLLLGLTLHSLRITHYALASTTSSSCSCFSSERAAAASDFEQA